MQIIRVYTGADGESHFEDLTPEQLALIVNNLGDGPHLELPPFPLLLGLSPAPRRQYVVNLSDWRNLRRLTGARDGSPLATSWWPKT